MASIRSKGTINKWLDDKGFGFITPEKSSMSIFIHISAFDRGTPRRPKVGDTIFYQVRIDNKGKTKAVDASIEGVSPISRKAYTPRTKKRFKERSPRNSLGIVVLCIALLIGAGGTVFNYFRSGNIQQV